MQITKNILGFYIVKIIFVEFILKEIEKLGFLGFREDFFNKKKKKKKTLGVFVGLILLIRNLYQNPAYWSL